MIGVLWYDDDPKVGLEEKVRGAARCYRERHGRPATLVQVWPGALGGEPLMVEGVKVVESQYVQVNHYLVGEGDE